MGPEITVVIADDHPIFRRGLREIIEEKAGRAHFSDAARRRADVQRGARRGCEGLRTQGRREHGDRQRNPGGCGRT
jgi:hypothetical protein